MTEDEIVSASLKVGFTVAIVLALWAMKGIVAIYREEGGHKSVLFTSLIVTDIIAAVIGVIAFPIAHAALFQQPRPQWTGPILVFVIFSLMSMSVVHRLIFDRIRAQKSDSVVP